ncbi:MAG: Crp/Fnr family transcriptional regulator [Haliscomenobacter sp.]|nr:Crp/Fnr family transcriptional regulator [Haliscomenobacter sp.]MBK9492231.1 Crp/Fnr family transcriptional regulator [Haliscomenobacter sp.]
MGFILTNLPAKDLVQLQEGVRSESRKRGDVLFCQGAFPKGVYWLLSGKVKIFQETSDGQRQTHYIYSDGDLIGHRQFIAEEAHPVSAVLLEDGVVGFISGDTFRGLLNTSPHFARNILTALAREFGMDEPHDGLFPVFGASATRTCVVDFIRTIPSVGVALRRRHNDPE